MLSKGRWQRWLRLPHLPPLGSLDPAFAVDVPAFAAQDAADVPAWASDLFNFPTPTERGFNPLLFCQEHLGEALRATKVPMHLPAP